MSRKAIWTLVVVLLVTALAAGFRLYDLQNFPPGLFPDEAANGEDALLILDGDYRPFYPRGNGREGLYFYLQAASIALFGVGVWQLKLVSAVIGIATVPTVYFATRVWFGRLAGILAALFLATSHWHVTMSRTGFRAILIPLFVALFTAFAGYAVKSTKDNKSKRALVFAALAGAAFMGGFYTYIAYRVMVGVVLGVAILILLDDLILDFRKHPGEHLRDMPHVVRYWKHLIVAIVAGLIVFAPLGWFFIQEPESFVGRAGQVSIFNEELQQEYGGGTLLGTLLYSTRETLLAFFAGDGDLNWRHNVPGFPLLNPLVAILFLLGLAWTIKGTWDVAWKILHAREVHLGMVYPYLLLILVGMLAPIVTTAEGIPHGLRSIGLVLPIFMLAGTAGAVSYYWLKKKLGSGNIKSSIIGAGIGLVIVAMLFDGSLYFLIARNSSAAHYAYRSDLTEVAKYIQHVADKPIDSAQGKPYLVLDSFSVQTIHFLTSVAAHDHTIGDQPHPDVDQHLWRVLKPERAEDTVLEDGELIIFTQSTFPDADRYVRQHRDNIELIDQRFNRFNQEIMRVYRGVGLEDEQQDGLDVDASLDA